MKRIIAFVLMFLVVSLSFSASSSLSAAAEENPFEKDQEETTKTKDPTKQTEDLEISDIETKTGTVTLEGSNIVIKGDNTEIVIPKSQFADYKFIHEENILTVQKPDKSIFKIHLSKKRSFRIAKQGSTYTLNSGEKTLRFLPNTQSDISLNQYGSKWKITQSNLAPLTINTEAFDSDKNLILNIGQSAYKIKTTTETIELKTKGTLTKINREDYGRGVYWNFIQGEKGFYLKQSGKPTNIEFTKEGMKISRQDMEQVDIKTQRGRIFINTDETKQENVWIKPDETLQLKDMQKGDTISSKSRGDLLEIIESFESSFESVASKAPLVFKYKQGKISEAAFSDSEKKIKHLYKIQGIKGSAITQGSVKMEFPADKTKPVKLKFDKDSSIEFVPSENPDKSFKIKGLEPKIIGETIKIGKEIIVNTGNAIISRQNKNTGIFEKILATGKNNLDLARTKVEEFGNAFFSITQKQGDSTTVVKTKPPKTLKQEIQQEAEKLAQEYVQEKMGGEIGSEEDYQSLIKKYTKVAEEEWHQEIRRTSQEIYPDPDLRAIRYQDETDDAIQSILASKGYVTSRELSSLIKPKTLELRPLIDQELRSQNGWKGGIEGIDDEIKDYEQEIKELKDTLKEKNKEIDKYFLSKDYKTKEGNELLKERDSLEQNLGKQSSILESKKILKTSSEQKIRNSQELVKNLLAEEKNYINLYKQPVTDLTKNRQEINKIETEKLAKNRQIDYYESKKDLNSYQTTHLKTLKKSEQDLKNEKNSLIGKQDNLITNTIKLNLKEYKQKIEAAKKEAEKAKKEQEEAKSKLEEDKANVALKKAQQDLKNLQAQLNNQKNKIKQAKESGSLEPWLAGLLIVAVVGLLVTLQHQSEKSLERSLR